MSADPIRAITDAVLYEGYILWPYRRSALKNQRRFTFGGVYPPAHSAEHPDDRDFTQTEVLLRAPGPAEVEVTVRFLHVVRRGVGRRRPEGLEEVDELIVDGQRHLPWEEAVEREACLTATLGELGQPQRLPIAIEAGCDEEAIGNAGAFIRRWRPLRAELAVGAEPIAANLWRLTARVENHTPGAPASRADALEQTLCSTHTLLRSQGGGFVSLTDPPPEMVSAASACENVGTWPVLVGEEGERTSVLSSPIILEDYPRIAPESPGDLFDGGEIDQLLVLNILALTDDEKAEMMASDPKARAILERTEALTPEQLMALHGTVRDFGLTR
jgi:hypothetical protein